MLYKDGQITAEDTVINSYMEGYAESYREGGYNPNDSPFWNMVADNLLEEFAKKMYIVMFDDGTTVHVPQNVKNLTACDTQIGDLIRIGCKEGEFSKGCREYYNLSRGPPPKKPYKRYLNEVHKSADGNYTVVADPATKGRYVWEKIVTHVTGTVP